MPDYFDWNRALIEYFTAGAPDGSTIYLDVNDRNLDLIGRQFWSRDADIDWSQDYLNAVRQQVVGADPSPLVHLRRSDSASRPLGAAFLGVLVLVATRMDEDEDQQISDRDYFTRLNEALGTEPLNAQVRRPRLMKQGSQAEEPLWKAWATYLRENGYLPTASGGNGAWKYIGYAVSQTLLRPPEKRRLFRILDTKQWPEDLDPELMVSNLRREDALPVHLQNLLKRTGEAAEDVQHAIHDAFLEWLESGSEGGGARKRGSTKHLHAGLYRTTHWRSGYPEYALYPRQPRNQRGSSIAVTLEDQVTRLQVDRPGYYTPIGEIGKRELDDGARYPLSGHIELESLVLPKRDFWILREDPNAPGCFATLGRPSVGEHFTLLITDALVGDVERLKELSLLQSEPPVQLVEGWTEFPAAMVIANTWSDATDVALDLRDELSPTSGVGVSITGGLRVPRAGGWLVDGPPTVRVESFFLHSHLTVLLDDREIFSEQVEPGADIAVPWDGPGVYVLDAEARGEGVQRLVNLVDWSALPVVLEERVGRESASLGGGSRLLGPQLIRDEVMP